MDRTNSLVAQKKFAWAKYYEEVMWGIANNQRLNEKLEALEQQVGIPDHVKNEIAELHAETKKLIECPICYDTLNKDNLALPSCGHKYCSSCLDKIDTCAICRKKIYKKKKQ